MKKIAFLFSLVLSFSLAGCAGHLVYDGHCLTCFNDPITGKPVNYEKEPYESANEAYKEPTGVGIVTLSTKTVDVDSAFAAIKPEFGFSSPQELEQKHGTHSEWIKLSNGYAYDANPGAYYHMRGDKSHTFEGRRFNSVILDCMIQKDGAGSKITMTYYEGGVNSQAFVDSLLKRLQLALGVDGDTSSSEFKTTVTAEK